jgi:glutathione S-transferase
MWKLFHYPWAPYARKALLAAYELEVEVEEVITPPFDEGHMAELRHKTFPLATVPLLLLENGEFLSDSSLIVEYFDLHCHRPHTLFPWDCSDALKVRALDRFAEALLAPTVFLTWALRKPEYAQNARKIEQAFGRVSIACELLDAMLAGKNFVYGDSFTMADIGPSCALSILIADGSIGQDYLNQFLHVRTWFNGLLARPSWQRLLARADSIVRPQELATLPRVGREKARCE